MEIHTILVKEFHISTFSVLTGGYRLLSLFQVPHTEKDQAPEIIKTHF